MTTKKAVTKVAAKVANKATASPELTKKVAVQVVAARF